MIGNPHGYGFIIELVQHNPIFYFCQTYAPNKKTIWNGQRTIHRTKYIRLNPVRNDMAIIILKLTNIFSQEQFYQHFPCSYKWIFGSNWLRIALLFCFCIKFYIKNFSVYHLCFVQTDLQFVKHNYGVFNRTENMECNVTYRVYIWKWRQMYFMFFWNSTLEHFPHNSVIIFFAILISEVSRFHLLWCSRLTMGRQNMVRLRGIIR